MCGIFGFYNIADNKEALLKMMAREQIHRGPDSEGIYIDGHTGIGIRRLSVIDLETGDQPICNEDGTIWVVCNGEIYNYIELNAELRSRGHTLRTHSDVECIVHLYEEYGIEALRHLNGMFGLALYDGKAGRLFIARDRLGIKPLYYSARSNHCLFASELRSLLRTGLVSTDLDWSALSSFFDDMYISTPSTPFKDVRKLKAGHYMELGREPTPCEVPFWLLECCRPACIPKSEGEAIEQLEMLLRQATHLQLRADVPICAFLSGGIDSSAVVAFAAQQVSMPLRTYHVYFEGASNKIDERRSAQIVSLRYGTIHEEVRVNRQDFNTLIPKLIWHLEEPFGDLASIPTYVISEMARREVTVCLNGSGGDELFAGYSHHSNSIVRKELLKKAIDKAGLGQVARNILGRHKSSGGWKKIIPQYVAPRFRNSTAERKGNAFPGDRMSKILADDIDGYLQSNVLFLLDKVAMAVSLEGRVPLLDHNLVEYCAYLPSGWKLKNGERKYIFKKMLEQYLPHEVLYRKKEGFGAPLADWLNAETKKTLQLIILNGMLKKNGFISIQEASLLQLAEWDLWKLVCFELWYQLIAFPCSCPSGMQLREFV